MRLDVDENYVNFVEIGEDALYPLVLEASSVSARRRRRSATFNAHQENRRQEAPAP
jgi:hypothetical protein